MVESPVTIVIPAHNEANVVARCISAVLHDAKPAEFAVLVASNGSTDDTAARARAAAEALGHRIDVVELSTASKIAALRAADAYLDETGDAEHGARIYVDADVVLSTEAVRRLAAALQVSEPRLAMAYIDVDVSASSWLVRRYYDSWFATGYINRQDAGSGVFAMNRAGVARVQPLPDVINDDGYIARCFGADEKVVCDVKFRSFAPRSVQALIRRRARIVNGNRQLDAMQVGAAAAAATAPRSTQGFDLRTAVLTRQLPLTSAFVFVAVTAAARGLATWRRLTGAAGRWSTDTTTRSPGTPTRSPGTPTARK